jgi:hypothetical protein
MHRLLSSDRSSLRAWTPNREVQMAAPGVVDLPSRPDDGAAREYESDPLCQAQPDVVHAAPSSRGLAVNPPTDPTCVRSSSNDPGLPAEVEALCALLARANRRIAAERRSKSGKLRVLR